MASLSNVYMTIRDRGPGVLASAVWHTLRGNQHRHLLRHRFVERRVHDYRLLLDLEDPGISRSLMPLEQVMDQADPYILDYLHTSALGTILKSDKPVLYIDFDHCALWPEAGRLFSRRVRTVRGRHDGANRLQVDWQELRKGLRQSSCMTEDQSFVDTYPDAGVTGDVGNF